MLNCLQWMSFIDMSIELNKIEIINLINGNIYQFSEFEKVYIFGSILKNDKYSNDIGILLFSSNILKNINKIKVSIEQKIFYPVDITALSFEEEKEIGFIAKLDKKICIKWMWKIIASSDNNEQVETIALIQRAKSWKFCI